MERLKLRVHFSFWLFFAAAILLKQGFLAANYAVAMVFHECCHYLVAKRLFYRCEEIRLSAFGAVLYGDFSDVNGADRIAIALAGPLGNLAVCVVLSALWWTVPDSYVFTENFFAANLGMATVNLLPCYPLDGGRVATGVLEKRLGEKRSLLVVKRATAAIAVLLFAVFVFSLFLGQKLFSLGLFSIFLFTGLFGKGDNCYRKVGIWQSKHKFLKKGMERKTLVFSENATFADVVKRMRGNCLYNLEVVNSRFEVVERYSVAELNRLVKACPSNAPITSLRRYLDE